MLLKCEYFVAISQMEEVLAAEGVMSVMMYVKMTKMIKKTSRVISILLFFEVIW